MLQIDLGTIYRSEERRLKAGTTGVVEGQALVAAYENGELVVEPATGATGRFVGVAVSSVNPIKSVTKVEVLTTASDSKTLTLEHTPTSGSIAIWQGDTKLETAPEAATGDVNTNVEWHLDGKTLTVNENSKEYRIQYRYSPTVLEAINIQGEPEPGTHVSDVTETIGVITAGEVFTSEWVTTAAWAGTSHITTAANGRFSTATSAGNVSSGLVTKVPDTETGLLGFRFTA